MSFTAKYKGTCANCDEAIEPGQEVDYDDDDALVHVKCPTTVTPLGSVCPRCFCYHNGDC